MGNKLTIDLRNLSKREVSVVRMAFLAAKTIAAKNGQTVQVKRKCTQSK